LAVTITEVRLAQPRRLRGLSSRVYRVGVMVAETGLNWFHGGGVKLGMNPHHSMKRALQGVQIFAQEPALGIFRIFAVLQHIQNRLIHHRQEQTFGSYCLEFAGLSLHTRKPPLWLRRALWWSFPQTAVDVLR